MLLIVSDTSVLIDIECGELSSAMFSLPWQFSVPDILFSEELEQRHGHLAQLGLISQTMTGELVAEAYDLRQKYVKASMNDLLALVLARHESCQLLTGDKALRDIAELLNVEVHGTIWLVQQMIKYEKVTVEDAHIAFNKMKNSGSRLPWDEVKKIFFIDSR